MRNVRFRSIDEKSDHLLCLQSQLDSATIYDPSKVAALQAEWPFSIVLGASVIQCLIFIMLVTEQYAKYSKIIADAAPEKAPIIDRCTSRINKWLGR